MLILSEAQVRECLDMGACLAATRAGLIAVAQGTAVVPPRLGLPYHAAPSSNNNNNNKKNADKKEAADFSLFKPAALESNTRTNDGEDTTTTTTEQMGLKVVSIRRDNAAIGLPLVPATILHMEPATGVVDAVVAGTYLTGARTAAMPALAVQYVCQMRQRLRADSGDTSIPCDIQHVVIFGAGLQAELHVHALSCALHQPKRPFPKVTLINRTAPRAHDLAARFKGDGWVTECNVVLLHDDPKAKRDALATADVVCTTTNAVSPLWDDNLTEVLPNHCIITGIGSYTPDMQEIPPSAVNKCEHVWIDTPEARTVGDLKHLTDNSSTCSTTNNTTPPKLLLLGDVLQYDYYGDEIDDDFDIDFTGRILFKGVGTAILDVLNADIVVQRARELQLGTVVDMN